MLRFLFCRSTSSSGFFCITYFVVYCGMFLGLALVFTAVNKPISMGPGSPLVLERSEILQKSSLENGMRSRCRFSPSPQPCFGASGNKRGENPRIIWIDTEQPDLERELAVRDTKQELPVQNDLSQVVLSTLAGRRTGSSERPRVPPSSRGGWLRSTRPSSIRVLEKLLECKFEKLFQNASSKKIE